VWQVLTVIELKRRSCSSCDRRPDADGNGAWPQHAFCTTALFTWKLEPTDASCMACRSNSRVTLDMYAGSTADDLDRDRAATELLPTLDE
jgi:hypothetical protein